MSAPASAASVAKVLAVSYFAVFLGHNFWRTTFYHHGVESLALSPEQIGIVFSAASLPGLLAACVGAAGSRVRPVVILQLAVAALAAGMFLVAGARGFWSLLLGVFAIGVGFTFFYPLANDFYMEQRQAARPSSALGNLRSLGPLSAVAAGLLAMVLATDDDIPVALAAGAALLAVAGFAAAWVVRGHECADRQLAAKLQVGLWPYYVLNFLAGCRSALFRSFVVTMLVVKFRLPVAELAMVLMVGHFLTALGYRVLGTLSCRQSFANMLTGIYVAVAVLFLAFEHVPYPLFVALLWMDSLLFGTSLLTDSWLRRSVRPAVLAGNLGAGLGFFHLAGVLVPMVGAALLTQLGMSGLLAVGAALALGAAVVSRRLVDDIDVGVQNGVPMPG